jgi:hypothetical protein
LSHKKRALRQLVAQRAVHTKDPHTEALKAHPAEQRAEPRQAGVHKQQEIKDPYPGTLLPALHARLLALCHIAPGLLNNVLRIAHE